MEEDIPVVPNQQEPAAAGDELYETGAVTVAHPAPGLAVVSLAGEHDLSTQPTLTKALAPLERLAE